MVNATLREGPLPATVSRRTDALVASVAQHHRAVSAHQRRLLSAVAELDRRRAWRVDGATTMVAWLVQRCSVTAATAREWVTAAQKLESLPKISEALSQGKLSFDQVKPLVQVAKPDTDAQLAQAATQWSAKQVRELAVAAHRQTDQQAAGDYSRRFLRFDDRRRTLSGSLPDDHYARVKGALTARVARRRGDHRPFEQRMADALVELCGPGAGGAGPNRTAVGAGPNRTTVVVHADLGYLTGGGGGAELDVLGPLSPEVARRLACDARIILSADNEQGQSIQQGIARRNPNWAQRLEIRRRDKGCRFPGCTYTEFTDVHHVVHWLNGGLTAVPNLVTLCDQHHRAVHELGWKMSGDANALLTFRSPTGRVTTSMPSPTFTPARAGPPG
jgi:Domain of unknown function (DUF222)